MGGLEERDVGLHGAGSCRISTDTCERGRHRCGRPEGCARGGSTQPKRPTPGSSRCLAYRRAGLACWHLEPVHRLTTTVACDPPSLATDAKTMGSPPSRLLCRCVIPRVAEHPEVADVRMSVWAPVARWCARCTRAGTAGAALRRFCVSTSGRGSHLHSDWVARSVAMCSTSPVVIFSRTVPVVSPLLVG